MNKWNPAEIWKTYSPKLIDIDIGSYFKFLGSIFSKDTQPFDFIKHNVIWKLAYQVKYSSQINGGLIRFSEIWK